MNEVLQIVKVFGQPVCLHNPYSIIKRAWICLACSGLMLCQDTGICQTAHCAKGVLMHDGVENSPPTHLHAGKHAMCGKLYLASRYMWPVLGAGKFQERAGLGCDGQHVPPAEVPGALRAVHHAALPHQPLQQSLHPRPQPRVPAAHLPVSSHAITLPTDAMHQCSCIRTLQVHCPYMFIAHTDDSLVMHATITCCPRCGIWPPGLACAARLQNI